MTSPKPDEREDLMALESALLALREAQDRGGDALEALRRASAALRLAAKRRGIRLEALETADSSGAVPASEDAPLLAYGRWLASHAAGAWRSASEDRIYFVEYARETVDFWNAVERLSRGLGSAGEAELGERFPTYPSAAELEPLSRAALVKLLARIVRAERLRDGAFLSAVESGVVGRILEALAGRL